MKTKHLLIVIAGLLFFQVNSVSAQTTKVKSFAMKVKGTSSMHDWESQVEKLECKTSYRIENNVLTDLKEVSLRIPVEGIKSTKGSIMDNKTYDAFNHEKFPHIVFTLITEKINPAALTVELKGTLSMAGATKQIDILANYKILPNGDLQITGSENLKMTEYKMDPPTAMMGAIKVGDEVTISFDIILSSSTTTL